MRDFPEVVRIEPCGVCNFRCTHCPVGREGGRGKILSYANFLGFFSSLPKVPRVLILYHGGEPLLNKDLERMIDFAKLKGVQKIAFNTNASMLTEERDLSGVDELRVSFDGESEEDNNRIRVNGNFAKQADAVRRLALTYKRPKVIKIYNARQGTNKPAYYLKEYFSDCDVIFEGVEVREWARLKNAPKKTNGVTFCSDLFDTFTITSNGDVPMCCEDLLHDDIIGNVFQSSPLELWERMETRRDAFSKKDYPKLCQSCWVTTR
jgi:radical SAM protein with 4Fe4S-binding SPASM domain